MFNRVRKKSKKLSIIFFFVVVGLTLISHIQVSAEDYQDISVEDAKTRIDTIPGIYILDVRSEPEYENDGHIQGAVNINYYLFFRDFDEFPIDKDIEIIAYCDNGFRSKKAAEELVEDYNFTNVYNMLKGFNEWKKKGYPFIIGPDSITTTADISRFTITKIVIMMVIPITVGQRILAKKRK